ncbi:metal ABC transporter solute-binding protein, Zn/Mn family [Fictibacillus aquaticus]|uniref:Adhesin n=1 Tax=Fictibacillus aquaticus TaxID=2021314 RepID=A0A235FDB4_9BACL|nr:zinc ABC transporter substrate-binding protein [Fictibacillus aquaticus]OYD59192.1 adhesin [Fictibacillus aquaticus]
MKKILPVLFILTILLAACGQKTADKSNGKLHIYTTLYPLQYFTERIGGKHVSAESIVPPGADAHTFEPSTKTMVKLTEGDAFIYNKWGTDEFSSSIADTLKNEDVPVINAAKGIEYAHEEEHKEDEHGSDEHDDHGHAESGLDPHIWLDPVLAQQMAENIMNSLVKQKPSAKKEFEKNFAALEKDLQKLDGSFKELSSSPKKTFVVSHAAYGYWAERYGLEQMSISGLSPSHEPSQKQVEKIIQYVKKENISYILFEENVNNSVAKSIKKETGAGTLTLHNLETLTKNDIQSERDYLSIMQDNVETMKKALK